MSGPPLRIAFAVRDPDRAASLAATLERLGHSVAAEDDRSADVIIADAPPAAAERARPMLVLSDAPVREPDIAGVLRSDPLAKTLDAALRAVAAGLQIRELATAAPTGFAAAEESVPHSLLTPREMEILAAVGEGLSNKAAARRLGISAHTVKFHLEAIFSKLDAGSRAEAVAKGLRRGLIEL